jgi:hypothetical protein
MLSVRSGLEVDGQFEFVRLEDGDLTWFRTSGDLVDQVGSAVAILRTVLRNSIQVEHRYVCNTSHFLAKNVSLQFAARKSCEYSTA